jgi:hypothetical protein
MVLIEVFKCIPPWHALANRGHKNVAKSSTRDVNHRGIRHSSGRHFLILRFGSLATDGLILREFLDRGIQR